MAVTKHKELYTYLQKNIASDTRQFKAILAMASPCLTPVELANPGGIEGIVNALERGSWITMGNYRNLMCILEDAGLIDIIKEVERREIEIVELMKVEETTVTSIQEIPTSERLHYKLYGKMSSNLVEGVAHYQSFLAITRTFLFEVDMFKKDVFGLLSALKDGNWITIGDYSNLIKILGCASLNALKSDIEDQQTTIREEMAKEKKSVQRVKEISKKKLLHCQLFVHINRNLTKKMAEFNHFATMASTHVPTATLAEHRENAVEMLWLLEAEGVIGVGNYDVLLNLLREAGLRKLEGEIRGKATEIQQC